MTRRLYLVGAVILTAGILFGYDQGVISGALRGIESDFDLGTTMVEVITSFVTLGALVGALVAGVLADRIGRRPAVLIAGVLFIVGAIVEAAAPGATVLTIGRLIVGFAVGVASVAAPLYAAEMAPSRLRGTFVSTYQFGITFGIFVAYLVDEWLQSGSEWRLMLGLSAVAGVVLIVLLLPLRDTPRWYLKAGRPDDAAAELERIHPGDSEERFRDLQASLADEPMEATWGEVFSPRWRRPLMIGLGLAVFQQVTGINAIIYYADKIFAAAGFSSPADQTAATTWAIGAVNVLATLIAIAFVDRLGRKPLLIAGLIGMATSLTVVGISFLYIDGKVEAGASTAANHPNLAGDAGIVTLVALVVYIASFAFSLGPIVWTMINEIYPRSVRGRAVSVATAANWFSAWVVSQFFLSLVDAVGESGTFFLFAVLCVVCLAWIVKKVPETKGRTLEEIEQMWIDGDGGGPGAGVREGRADGWEQAGSGSS
ncbi:MAG: sugar porter family MFS transporter [Actinobacteria bacterium]|nr:sugar porter family MFS transporter [Actinomycetota bacterium]